MTGATLMALFHLVLSYVLYRAAETDADHAPRAHLVGIAALIVFNFVDAFQADKETLEGAGVFIIRMAAGAFYIEAARSLARTIRQARKEVR